MNIENIINNIVDSILNKSEKKSEKAENILPQSQKSFNINTKLISENTLNNIPENSTVLINKKTIITPLAKDIIYKKKIKLQSKNESNTLIHKNQITLALGSDHGGFKYKEALKKYLENLEYNVIDVGTHNQESCDYPDFAKKVGEKIQDKTAQYGIMIDGAGIGSAMVLNKMNGILAANCFNEFTAVNSKAHNNANVLTLGSNNMTVPLMQHIVKTWLNTEFQGGRHLRRVNKITGNI